MCIVHCVHGARANLKNVINTLPPARMYSEDVADAKLLDKCRHCGASLSEWVWRVKQWLYVNDW